MSERLSVLKELEEKPIRLQVYLAHAGIASRRSAEGLITAGRVSVNGLVVSVLGEKVMPGDLVCLDGVPVRLENVFQYFLLNKPAGYICSAFDPQNRPLAISLLPRGIKERLYNVGRLDFNSSGLIIFTNDGGFAAKISHPSAEIEKEYILETSGLIPDVVCESFLGGITIEGIVYKAKCVERLGKRSIRVVLIEGKNREIRRVFSHFHLHLISLQRVRIGSILIGDLKEGESRSLSNREISDLLCLTLP